jgi:hypothetical protein
MHGHHSSSLLQIGGGVVGALTLAVCGTAAAAYRPADPVVLTGAKTPSLVGIAPPALPFFLRCRRGLVDRSLNNVAVPRRGKT